MVWRVRFLSLNSSGKGTFLMLLIIKPTLSFTSNYRQRSLYGFRMSTLLGWLGGDAFKYDIHS